MANSSLSLQAVLPQTQPPAAPPTREPDDSARVRSEFDSSANSKPEGFAGAMKHAQAQEKPPERAPLRRREANTADTATPRARLKAERKPAAKSAESPEATGTNPPAAGKKLPSAADSEAANEVEAQGPQENGPPGNVLPLPVVPQVPTPMAAANSTAAGEPAVTAATPAGASSKQAADAAPSSPAKAADRQTVADFVADAIPGALADGAGKPAVPSKIAAPPSTIAPPAVTHLVPAGTDANPPPAPAADPAPGAVASTPIAAATTVDLPGSGKPKLGSSAGANPASTGTAADPAATLDSPTAAQALINNPVPALNASAPGSDRDAASRGTAQLQTANVAVPDAATPVATAQVNTAAASTAAAADPAVFKLHQNMDAPDFPQALSDKVAWLVDKDIGSAKLQINPPQLGPIDVHIEVQGDKAQVWLSAHSVVTREALEAASPKLRDMLGTQGFAQVNVDVSQRSFQDRSAPPTSTPWSQTAARSNPDELFSAPAALPRRAGQGALDAYA